MVDDTNTPQAGAAPGVPAMPDAPAAPAVSDASAAPAMQAASPGEALSSAAKVEELADRLSACADGIHARVMRDIRAYHGGDVPQAEQDTARLLLDGEQELRQRADRLYADAAACIVGALGAPQQHVIQLTADAAAKIQTIVRLGDGVGLVARLLGLAAAAATAQPLAILAALKGLKVQIDVIALHNPAAAAPAPADPPTSA